MGKKNGYILALIAAIIAFISLITPIAYHSSILIDSYIWMWGLYTWKVFLGDTNYEFIEDSDYLMWGLLATILIILAIIILISTAIKANKRNRNYGAVWILSGLLLIAAPIVYFIGLSEEIPTFLSEIFWDFYDFHFAFFGPFIAGALAIVGGIIK